MREGQKWEDEEEEKKIGRNGGIVHNYTLDYILCVTLISQ